jgi:signal transduction histidine kinase
MGFRDWDDRRVGDVVLAVGVGALQLFGTYMAARSQPDHRAFDALAVLLLGSGSLALIARRRAPVAVFVFGIVTTFGYVLLDYPAGPIWGTLIVALYTVMTTGHRVVGYAGAVLGFTSLWWEPPLVDRPVATVGEGFAFAAWFLILLGGCEIIRVRRAYAEERRHREEEADRAQRTEQRLAIARDLHDVLAHNISLMNVQASTALHLLDTHPEQARPALEAVKHASSEALTELRGVLEALRHPDSRAPAPTLARVEELTAQAAAAGLEIETAVEGEPRPLPAGVELAAYRICQEAVTNVIRHASARSARLTVAYGADALTVEIVDDGRGGNGSAGGGNGLPGMRERTAAIGGSLEAGPRPEGGFRVRAKLPLPRADRSVESPGRGRPSSPLRSR